MIRVCLVEDQTLVRQGIQTLLGLVDDIDVVAEAKDGDEALHVIPQSKPDVVLLDMYLPKRNGLEVLRELKRSEFFPPTLILTTFDEDKFVLGGLQAGAKGYLLKGSTTEELELAVGKPGADIAVGRGFVRGLAQIRREDVRNGAGVVEQAGLRLPRSDDDYKAFELTIHQHVNADARYAKWSQKDRDRKVALWMERLRKTN